MIGTLMTSKNPDKASAQAQNARRMALVSVQAGCLTFAIAGSALLVGLWLDARLGTAPRWTLMILLGSAPLTFGGIFWLIRRALRSLREQGDVTALDKVDKDFGK